jgi:hypothetical protein
MHSCDANLSGMRQATPRPRLPAPAARGRRQGWRPGRGLVTEHRLPRARARRPARSASGQTGGDVALAGRRRRGRPTSRWHWITRRSSRAPWPNCAPRWSASTSPSPRCRPRSRWASCSSTARTCSDASWTSRASGGGWMIGLASRRHPMNTGAAESAGAGVSAAGALRPARSAALRTVNLCPPPLPRTRDVTKS